MRAVEPWRGGIVGTALEGFAGGAATGRVLGMLGRQAAPATNPSLTSALEELRQQTRDLAVENGRLRARLDALAGDPALARLAELEARLARIEGRRAVSLAGGGRRR